MIIPLKIKRGDFFQRDSIPILVSRTVKTRKFKLLYFRNETCYRNGNWYKDLLFVYLQPSISKNSKNLAILTLQFDVITVNDIYTMPPEVLHLQKEVNLGKCFRNCRLPPPLSPSPKIHCWSCALHLRNIYRYLQMDNNHSFLLDFLEYNFAMNH